MAILPKSEKIVCFVAMPIGRTGADVPERQSYDYWKRIYEQLIRPAVQGPFPNIVCFRADDEKSSGQISTDILTHIYSDALCIVDLSDKNPNVYYELGLRDSWHSRTILIAQSANDIAFDKFNSRTILYAEQPIEAVRRFESEMKSHISEMIGAPQKVRNEVQGFLLQNKGTRPQSAATSTCQRVEIVLSVMNCTEVRGVEHTKFIRLFRREADALGSSLYVVLPVISNLDTERLYMASFIGAVRELKTKILASLQSQSSVAGVSSALLFRNSITKIIFVVPSELDQHLNRELLRLLTHHFEENSRSSIPQAILGSLVPLDSFSIAQKNVQFELWDENRLSEIEATQGLVLRKL